MHSSSRLLVLEAVTAESSKASSASKGGMYGSLLHEVQDEARNVRPGADHDEERPTRYPGQVPNLRDEDVQDRQVLDLSLFPVNQAAHTANSLKTAQFRKIWRATSNEVALYFFVRASGDRMS